MGTSLACGVSGAALAVDGGSEPAGGSVTSAVAVGSSDAGGSVSGATDSGASLGFGSANTITSLPFDSLGSLTTIACRSSGEPMIVWGSAFSASAMADASGTIGQSTSCFFGQTESTPSRP